MQTWFASYAAESGGNITRSLRRGIIPPWQCNVINLHLQYSYQWWGEKWLISPFPSSDSDTPDVHLFPRRRKGFAGSHLENDRDVLPLDPGYTEPGILFYWILRSSPKFWEVRSMLSSLLIILKKRMRMCVADERGLRLAPLKVLSWVQCMGKSLILEGVGSLAVLQNIYRRAHRG